MPCLFLYGAMVLAQPPPLRPVTPLPHLLALKIQRAIPRPRHEHGIPAAEYPRLTDQQTGSPLLRKNPPPPPLRRVVADLDRRSHWARERGLKRVGLWAPVSEPAALALYSRAGFKGTGRQRPMPGNADLQISEMEIEL